MATLKQYVDSFINTVTGFLTSDDSLITEAQMTYWINYYRAKYLVQYTDFGKEIHQDFYQDLGNWELERIDKADSPDVTFGLFIRRTVNPIPKAIEFPMNRGSKVGSTDKQHPYIMTTAENAPYVISNPQAQAAGCKWWYPLDSHAYVFDSEDDGTGIKYVNVKRVLQDPTQGHYYYGNGSGRAYNTSVDNYPMPDAFADLILKEIIRGEFAIAMQTGDFVNNAAPILPMDQTKSQQ